MLPNLKTVANSVQELSALLQCLGPERNPAGRAALPLQVDTHLDQQAWEALFRNEVERKGDCAEWRCIRWLEGLFYIVELPLSITRDPIASTIAKAFSNILLSGLNDLGRLGSDFVDMFDTPVRAVSQRFGGEITRIPAAGWVPRSRERESGALKPTAVLEVGVTGSSDWMFENARTWLSDFSSVSTVISIYVNASTLQKLKSGKMNGGDANGARKRVIPAKLAIFVRTDGENEGVLWERGWFDMNSGGALRELEQQGLALSALYMESGSKPSREAEKLVALKIGVVKQAIDEHYGLVASNGVGNGAAPPKTMSRGSSGLNGRPKMGKPDEEVDEADLALEMMSGMKGLSSDSLGIEDAPPKVSMFDAAADGGIRLNVDATGARKDEFPDLTGRFKEDEEHPDNEDHSSNNSDWNEEKLIAQQVAEIDRAHARAAAAAGHAIVQPKREPPPDEEDEYLELLAGSAGVNSISDLRLLLEQYAIEYRAKQLPELPKELETTVTMADWYRMLTGADGMEWRVQPVTFNNHAEAACVRWEQDKMWLVELDCSYASAAAAVSVSKQIVPLGFSKNWLTTGVTFIDQNLGYPVRLFPAGSFAPDPVFYPELRAFILEIGVFRTRETLLEDARYWLDSCETVQAVMLMHLDEAKFDWRSLPMAYTLIQRGSAENGGGYVQTPWIEFGFDSGAKGPGNECTRAGLVIADIPFIDLYPAGTVPEHLENAALSIDMFRIQQTVYSEMIEKSRLKNNLAPIRAVDDNIDLIPLPPRGGGGAVKRQRDEGAMDADDQFIGETFEATARPSVTKTAKRVEGELPAEAAAAAVHEYVTQLVTQSLANNPQLTEALSKMMAGGQLPQGADGAAGLAQIAQLANLANRAAPGPATPFLPPGLGFGLPLGPLGPGGIGMPIPGVPGPPAPFYPNTQPGAPPAGQPNMQPWFIQMPAGQAAHQDPNASSAPDAPAEGNPPEDNRMQ